MLINYGSYANSKQKKANAKVVAQQKVISIQKPKNDSIKKVKADKQAILDKKIDDATSYNVENKSISNKM